MHHNSSYISDIETVIIHAPIGILGKIYDSIKPLGLNTIKSFEYSKIQEFVGVLDNFRTILRKNFNMTTMDGYHWKHRSL